jgi:PAS domain S-box-containing protein
MFEQETTSLESEACFRALFEYATVGILVIGSDGRIELANPAIEKLFGYSSAELTGRPVEILIPHSFRKKHIHHREGYFDSPKVRPMGQGISLHALRKNGEQFPVEISLGYYQLGKENLAVAFVSDISQRIGNEEKYRNLFENSLVAMIITDFKTQKVIDVNNTGVQFFGYQSKEDLFEHFNPVAHFVYPNEREKNYQSAINHCTDGITNEQEITRLDGTRFWARIYVKLNHEKNLAQIFAFDITENRRAQEGLEMAVQKRTLELTESLKREKELNDIKSYFVSMASHEFRTPLTAILSGISLVEMYKKENQEEKRHKHIERIKVIIKDLVSVLDDFLSLEKLESGREVINGQTFDLHQLSLDLLREVDVLLKKGQQINFKHTGDNEVIQDKKIFKYILLNLLSNAIKYSEEFKEIHLLTEVNNNSMTIRVKDEGIGIPEADQANLFNRFFRASNVSHIQGTGLGLNIVKKYVELLNGTIQFHSQAKVGTTFTLTMPQKFAKSVSSCT